MRSLHSFPVHDKARLKIQGKRIIEFYLHLFFSGEVLARIIVSLQMPFVNKGSDILCLCSHTKIYCQAFAASVYRWNDPVMSGPIELLIDFDFCPGMVAPRIPPEISLEIHLPVGRRLWGIGVQRQVIVVIGILDFSIVERCLQVLDVFSWVFQRRQGELLRNLL